MDLIQLALLCCGLAMKPREDAMQAAVGDTGPGLQSRLVDCWAAPTPMNLNPDASKF